MDMTSSVPDSEVLMRRAGEFLQAGRARAARPLLAAARRLTPRSRQLSLLAAQLALQDGVIADASREMDNAIAAWPTDAEFRKCRAGLRRDQGDVEGAARDAAEAVILDRADPSAKALLGILMAELGRGEDAISCLREAVAAAPAEQNFRLALAAAQEFAGNPDSALETLCAGPLQAPGSTALSNAAILICVRRRDFQRAIDLAEPCRRDGMADACTFGLAGHALSSLGRHAEALTAYKEALKLGPDDPYVRHLVAAGGAIPGEDRAPPAYLRAVFDGYAERFDEHLIALQYRVPGLIRRAVQAHPAIAGGGHVGPVLDLGCGTGLAGVAISDLAAGPIDGIDVSGRMLAEARAKGIYRNLQESELTAALQAGTTRWQMVLAADVFCYFGALEEVFAAVHSRLEDGGWFILSVEQLAPDHTGTRWALLQNGRYAHAADYVRAVAHASGFSVLSHDREVARYENGAPVNSLLLTLIRDADRR